MNSSQAAWIFSWGVVAGLTYQVVGKIIINLQLEVWKGLIYSLFTILILVVAHQVLKSLFASDSKMRG